MPTLREAAQRALEALEYAEQNHGGDDCYFDAIEALRAALAQPEREWQGLTDEEVRRIVQGNTDPWCDTPETDGYGVVEMVEAKLKEKNGL